NGAGSDAARLRRSLPASANPLDSRNCAIAIKSLGFVLVSYACLAAAFQGAGSAENTSASSGREIQTGTGVPAGGGASGASRGAIVRPGPYPRSGNEGNEAAGETTAPPGPPY